MAEERILPSLKARLELDSSELAKAQAEAGKVKSSLAAAGDGAKEGGTKVTEGLVNPLKLATTVAGVFAAKKIFDFGKAGFNEMADAERVTAQTNATLKATGFVAGVTADNVVDLAGSLSELSGVDDQVVQSGANMLLTFKAVKNQVGEGNDVFNQATTAALDLSTAGFGSMESASVMLGKALQDPIKGVTALQRVGVGFTDAQKATIKALVETGDVLGAQKIILKEVESQVGGSAKAYGETLPGQIAKAKHSLDDMKASIIVGAAPALNFLAEKTQAASEFIAGLPEPIRQTIAAVGVAAAAFLGLGKPVLEAITVLQRFKDAQAAAAAASEAAAAANAAASAANASSAAATAGAAAALGPLGIAATAAAAAISLGLLVALKGNAESSVDAKTATDAFTQALKENSDAALDNATATVLTGTNSTKSTQAIAKAFGDANIPMKVFFDEVREGTGDLGPLQKNSELGGIALKYLDYNLKNAADSGSAFAQSLLDAHKSGRLSTDQVVEAIKAANTFSGALGDAKSQQELFSAATDKSGTSLGEAGAEAEFFAAETDKLKAAQDALKSSVASVGSALDSAYGRTLDPAKLLADLEEKTDSLTEALKKNGQTLDINTEKGRLNQQAVFAAGEAVAKLVEQKFKETGSLVEAQAAGNAYVEGLRAQLKAAGLTQTQVQTLIEQMHLTPKDIETTFGTNAPEVKAIVDDLVAHINEVPPDKQTQFRALIDQGKFAEAEQLLRDLARDRDVRLNIIPAIGFDPRGIAEAVASIPGYGKASGGPVTAGMPYIVGEHRPELFVPDVPGRIIPQVPDNWGMGGGVSVQQHFTINGSLSQFQMMQMRRDMRAEAEAVMRRVLA